MRNDGTTDMDNIRRYGLAIAATEQIIAHPDWLFTDEDYVVSGVTARKVQTKNVIINVDESVERLSMLALKIIRGGIKPHFAIFRMVFADYHDVSSR